MKTEVGRNCYQSIQYDKLSGRQVSFSGPQWTPSREEHKRFKRLLNILTPSQPVYAPLVMVSIGVGSIDTSFNPHPFSLDNIFK